MKIDLVGKTALVTGASRGIGRAIAIAYAAAGADVVLAARSKDALDETAAAVREQGRDAVALTVDVTDRDAVHDMVAQALAAYGQLDVIVNNAGGTSFMVPFEQLRFDGWTKVMRLNTESVVHVCQAVAPHLLERGSGSVINVASVAAFGGVPALSPYGASKAAVVSLTKSLAMEWASRGIRVNALCPGWTETELNRTLWENPESSAAMAAGIPMQRWGSVDDMTGAAVFLASDAASYITGQALVVDGGITAQGTSG